LFHPQQGVVFVLFVVRWWSLAENFGFCYLPYFGGIKNMKALPHSDFPLGPCLIFHRLHEMRFEHLGWGQTCIRAIAMEVVIFLFKNGY